MRAKSNSAIYRPDLGQVVMEYIEGPDMAFIGQEIMPVFPTAKQSSTFPVIPKEVMLKVHDTKRTPRGGYNRGDWNYERGKFSTSENGWEEPVDYDERSLFDQESPGMADIIAVQRANKIIMRNQERRISGKIFNATNFTAHAVTNEWDDATNATPIDDVDTGVQAFRLQCGMTPDALVIAYSTFRNLRRCDQIIDLIKYTFPGLDINKMNTSQLAQVLGVPRVLVGGGVYDSAGRGLDTTVADIWSNEYAALVKISRGMDLTEPGVGRTFIWTAESAENPIVEQYRDETIRSDIFRVRHNTDERLIQSVDDSGTVVSNIAAACVYLFSNITT